MYWLLVFFWLTGVATYWWHFVPAVPERVILHGRDQFFAGRSADGALMFVHIDPASNEPLTGPVKIVDPLTGQLLRRFGNAGQKANSIIRGSTHLCLRSSDSDAYIDVRTGKVLMTRLRDADEQVQFSSDGKLFAIASADRVSMFETETSQQLWTRQFANREPDSLRDETIPLHKQEAFVSSQFGQLVHVTLEGPKDANPTGSYWLNSRTGETDRRFENAVELIESPDGRFVLYTERDDSALLSLVEDRVVCRIPAKALHCEFSTDPPEIRELSWTEKGPRLSRRSIPDGVAIGPTATDADREWHVGVVARHGRSFASIEERSELFGMPGLVDVVEALGLTRYVDRFIQIQSRAVLRSADGQSPLLLAAGALNLDDPSIQGLMVDQTSDPNLFAVALPDCVQLFRFDAPRNWLWLIAWGLVPIALVWLILRAWS